MLWILIGKSTVYYFISQQLCISIKLCQRGSWNVHEKDREMTREISFTSLSNNCIIIRFLDAEMRTEKAEKTFLWNSISWLPVDAILWLAIRYNNRAALERERGLSNKLTGLIECDKQYGQAAVVRQNE